MLNQKSSIETRYLGFSLGQMEYAIPLLTVKEVIAQTNITQVPQTSAHFLGIINLRGQVISILDLRLKIQIKAAANAEAAIIICDFSTFCLGMVVDSINSVLSPGPDEISTDLHMHGQKSAKYVTGVFRRDQQLVLLLDPNKVIDLDDRVFVANQDSRAA